MASTRPKLTLVRDKISFSNEELVVLQHWDEIGAFKESLERSKNEKRPLYTFYDGPPFATGKPHYGHLLAGTIKDIVTRYAQQTGHHVERRFGWDCHGLPVEYEIDQKLGIRSKEDVMKLGIQQYNAECRAIVQRYTKEWEYTVKRIGRWIDFEHSYKTMDRSYMESVWWVFKQLYEKGMVYRGFKVMPYSTACTTPLSNFEANLNYKDTNDPAIVVAFPTVEDSNTLLLIWTTTPWTLPSNLAITVNPTFTYVKVLDKKSGHHYVILKTRLSEIYPAKKSTKKQQPEKSTLGEHTKQSEETKQSTDAVPSCTDEYQIVEEFLGQQLSGTRYSPLFPYFSHLKTAFRVITGDFVTADSGTGLVHCAAAFGEDDYQACISHGVVAKGAEIPCPVDANGCFTSEVTEFAGLHVKAADKAIIAKLKTLNRLIQNNMIVHSYPFCWRSDTPLIYKAVPSWFVSVESFKDRLLACNEETYWVPSNIKAGRFQNWLKDARDWAISRNRYWGTPLPIWTSEDGKEVIVVGSVEELSQLSGVPVEQLGDLHMDKIEHVTIPSKQGNGLLKRVPEVFDCWFESGSMPYAQSHYPFENKEMWERGFPADFVAEGLDQTRGWFYTLMVLSTALFDKPAFKNLICNGLVLAADGKKMSKRLKNYPDPLSVIDKYGADALRLYLINSPVVRAEPLRFQEQGVHEVVKKVFLPWFHAYRFFVENALRFENSTGEQFSFNPSYRSDVSNTMDHWVLASLQSLIGFVHTEMGAYRLYTVVPRLLEFIDQLTNWYVRMNRKRLKGADGIPDTRLALATLYDVLQSLNRLMAPFTPFLAELMYQNLRMALPESERLDSVHYLSVPDLDVALVDVDIERKVNRMQTVIELGRFARDNRKLSMKRPLKEVIVVHKNQQFLDDVRVLENYVKEELNVQQVTLEADVTKWARVKAIPDRKALGPRLGKKLNDVVKAIGALSSKELDQLELHGSISMNGEIIKREEVELKVEFQASSAGAHFEPINGAALVILNVEDDPALLQQWLAREVINRIQQSRKLAGLQPHDEVEIIYDVEGGAQAPLKAAIDAQKEYIHSVLLRNLHYAPLLPSNLSVVMYKNRFEIVQDIDDNGSSQSHFITVELCRPRFWLSDSAATDLGLSHASAQALQCWVASRDFMSTKAELTANGGVLSLTLDGTYLKLIEGKHIFATAGEYIQSHNSV